jgi:RND family efflux transporter MFP subunit
VDWQKYVRLAEQNATARRQLELAETRYRSSRINLELATKRLASLRDQLETERNAASRQVQLLSSRASDYVITAAIAGKVYSRNVELGELVSPQTPLFIIGSADRFLLKLLVDEEDINLIAPGQKCLIRLENYTDSLFEGKVVRILPQIQPESNSFLVEAVLNQAPAKLYNGLSVEANIITRQKDRALVIPAAYLQAGDSVWVANGKQHEKRPVVVGLRTLDWVEITQGLDTETEVFLPKQ